MEKELIKALEKLEKLVSDKKIENYSFDSTMGKNGNFHHFDIVESVKDKKIFVWLTAEDVLKLDF